MDPLWISARCYEGEASPDGPVFHSLRENHPVAGTDYHLQIPRAGDTDDRFLRDPEDREKTQELARKMGELMDQVAAIDKEYNSYFEYPDDDEP